MQQEKALAILKSGKNVFLTGSAGTGKTYVLNEYINYLRARKVPVAVTASTGIAATHMNGMTIHSWSGIGVKEHLTQGNLASMKSKKYLKKNLGKAKILIIDEISMLHKNQLNLVDKVLRYFKENQEPFGGIQVVLSGDFFQLPPIGNYGEKSRDKFSFMSEAWVNANFNVCYLTEQYRQTNNSLNVILNEIRTGKVSQHNLQTLKEATEHSLKNKEIPTKLFTHNIDVDRINTEHLVALEGRTKTFKASFKGNKKLVDTLKNSVLASENLQLKIGAKVMFVKNNTEKGFVNGTLGKVTGFNEDGFPKVQLSNGRIITVEKEDWSIQDDHNKVLASFSQFPLRLAWAITVHKCQGMTLDEAEINLSKTFERGQGYVALSRLKRIENLQLKGLNEMALKVDALAHKADVRFQELSKEVDEKYTLDELKKMAPPFIRSCGGTTNAEDIEKNKKKIKEKKSTKQSTYEVTLSYLRQKKPLFKIAKERGLTAGTISSHVIRIRKDYPKEDLSFYKPKKALFNKVKKVYDLQPKDKPLSSKTIFDALNGEVGYEEIKLCIAFM
ncbi:AAA family ATPase [Aureibaculum sp. 2210JD6-5]|uniref:AAA family ATPase n=1 Tax=Aureibaculum sp. 2210JD6-5 TaxID=3103957 RepID=UPI002AAD955F|nr:AAA family ATPase [Aureibaculum sp. 2210JD6-5]MDY7395557.1 AAA family ATPase [Aureibaculum sp. 2210JD6-5]